MEEAMAARYWCYRCSQMVNPVMGVEMKCPVCQGGFIEEMDGTTRDNPEPDSEFGPERPLSLWAPILMGMMNNPRRRRRLRRQEFEEDDDEDNDNENDDAHGGNTELDRELDSIIRRRRRSSSSILQLLRGIRAAGLASESENSESDRDGDRDRDRERERERLILINPFNQTVILHGSYDSSQGQNNNPAIGSLGDYFVGPGLDLLLQHLAENDPNRYGTPPAQKEAVEALPTVTIKENLQCSVCLDDFNIGVEAKEMPCKHKFHGDCILPWLELHSSCPVCRFQLPADEAKQDSNHSRNSSNQRDSENTSGAGEEGDEDGDGDGDGDGIAIGRNGSGRRFQIPWPFNLFSSTESQSSGSGVNSSSSANATGSGSGSGSSQTDDN